MTHTTDTTAAVRSLLAPARLGPLHLPNHLVMAPLTRNRAAADGTATPLMATYYAQRATAGLIIAEASTPNAVGQTYPNITAIHTPSHVAAGGASRTPCGPRAAGRCSSSFSTAAGSGTRPPAD